MVIFLYTEVLSKSVVRRQRKLEESRYNEEQGLENEDLQPGALLLDELVLFSLV